jgi:hypothetical protein
MLIAYRTNGKGVDIAASEMVRGQLRTIRFGDAIRTLAAVCAVIAEVDDHPTLGSVQRTVEKINARIRN